MILVWLRLRHAPLHHFGRVANDNQSSTTYSTTPMEYTFSLSTFESCVRVKTN